MVPITVVIPESVTAEGNVKVAFVPAIANPEAPTTTELNAAGSVDLSCFLMPDWAGIGAEQNKGESRRFCSRESFERLGRIRRTIGDIVYTYLPQDDGADAGNKAYTTLQEGTTGFLVLRYGLDASDAFAAAQKLDIIPAEMGSRSKTVSGTDEFAPLTVTQGIGATGVLVEDAVVAS